jgi:hypothetical protein
VHHDDANKGGGGARWVWFSGDLGFQPDLGNLYTWLLGLSPDFKKV